MKKIVIIGGGIAGLTAAYLLNLKYDIRLYEKEDRLGGNAYTYKTRDGVTFDIAVAAYSKLVSKNFLKLLSKLNIQTILQPTSALLSLHNLDTQKGIYFTPSLKGLISKEFSLFRPEIYSELKEANWARKRIINFVDNNSLNGYSVADVLAKIPELKDLRLDLMMAPLCLLSSMYYKEVMNGPAEFFFNKLKAFGNFDVLKMIFSLYFPKKFTSSYIAALASHYEEKVIKNSSIRSVSRENGNVILTMADGQTQVFDKVVFACNADQALALLENPTNEEKKVLGAWRYKDGEMVVHKDSRHFPKRELCQAWTCLRSQDNGFPHFSISCCTWRLCPGTPKTSEYFSTQHINFDVKEDLVDLKKTFRTPIFDFNSVPTIKALPSLNGKMNSYYCGSHFGYGLHNDAVTSAIDVARLLDVEWQ